MCEVSTISTIVTASRPSVWCTDASLKGYCIICRGCGDGIAMAGDGDGDGEGDGDDLGLLQRRRWQMWIHGAIVELWMSDDDGRVFCWPTMMRMWVIDWDNVCVSLGVERLAATIKGLNFLCRICTRFYGLLFCLIRGASDVIGYSYDDY